MVLSMTPDGVLHHPVIARIRKPDRMPFHRHAFGRGELVRSLFALSAAQNQQQRAILGNEFDLVVILCREEHEGMMRERFGQIPKFMETQDKIAIGAG